MLDAETARAAAPLGNAERGGACSMGEAGGGGAGARVSRRRLLGGVAGLAAPTILPSGIIGAGVLGAGVIGPGRRARAEEAPVVLRFGHAAPSTFPLHYRLIEAAGQIALKSEGRVKLQLFADSLLGSPIGLLAQTRAGTLDGAALSNQTLATDLSSMALPYLGFAWGNYADLWKAMDGAFGAFLVQQMAERLGLIAVPFCTDFGFRQITTWNKTITTAADLAGLRIRTPAEGPFVQVLQALGALPVTFSLQDTQQALATHAADGEQGLLALVKEAKLYDVQNRCALTNHIWDGHWIVFSAKTWQKLPAATRDLVRQAMVDAIMLQRQDSVQDERGIRALLEKHGMIFNAVDLGSFRAALRKSGYYTAWRGRVNAEAWSMLEKFTGPLAS